MQTYDSIGIIARAAALALFFPATHLVAAAAAPSFANDVAPIFNRSCVICHRPGEAAPMSLMTYEDVRPWARSIRQRVSHREMPPWSADATASAKFKNDPRLSAAEIQTIVAWVDAGAPKGDTSKATAPAFADGWRDPSGQPPDFVLTLPVAYEVPSASVKGNAGALNPTFYVKVPFDDDKWFRAVQARPDQRQLVHYMDLNIVEFPDGVSPPGAVVPEGGAAAQGQAQEIAFLVGNFRPGAGFEMFPAGAAKRIPRGGTRYFQITMHYEPNGTVETDRSSFGFWWTTGDVRHEVMRTPATRGPILAEGKQVFNGLEKVKAGPTLATRVYYPTVPANTPRFEVTSMHLFEAPVTLYEVMPHAHNRASDFKYTLVFPDGREQVLLNVPRYDDSWQFAYELTEPVNVPAGAKLVVIAHYNNSSSNKTVETPDKAGSDMFMPTIQYSIEQAKAQPTAAALPQ
jgi:mono/diheme cytochrome c family protein